MRSNTDTEWENWGKKDPYFGVLTHERFRKNNLTKEAKEEFFDSGRGHVKYVISTCRKHIDKNFQPNKILDFGCGTGRLTIPFAEQAEEVTGIDISTSMLEECKKNCQERNITNVKLVRSDDDLSLIEEKFDLIHSSIVFQHIPPSRGTSIFNKLVTHLEEGGIGAIQLTFAEANYKKTFGSKPLLDRARAATLTTVRRIYRNIARLFPGWRERDPEMQMNSYDINKIMFIVQSAGAKEIFIDFTDHGGKLGVFLYFKKPSNAKQ